MNIRSLVAAALVALSLGACTGRGSDTGATAPLASAPQVYNTSVTKAPASTVATAKPAAAVVAASGSLRCSQYTVIYDGWDNLSESQKANSTHGEVKCGSSVVGTVGGTNYISVEIGNSGVSFLKAYRIEGSKLIVSFEPMGGVRNGRRFGGGGESLPESSTGWKVL